MSMSKKSHSVDGFEAQSYLLSFSERWRYCMRREDLRRETNTFTSSSKPGQINFLMQIETFS